MAEMLKITTMTMLRSCDDQRVQRDRHWSVLRAVTKAIKHQMSKWKNDKCDKTPDAKIEKNEQSKTQLQAIAQTI